MSGQDGSWPFAENDTHWIAMGMHRDLSEAFRIALRNTIEFLSRRARLLSRHDAYGLASMAVHFRITQVVDVNQGVHAMIPKEIFARSAGVDAGGVGNGAREAPQTRVIYLFDISRSFHAGPIALR